MVSDCRGEPNERQKISGAQLEPTSHYGMTIQQRKISRRQWKRCIASRYYGERTGQLCRKQPRQRRARRLSKPLCEEPPDNGGNAGTRAFLEGIRQAFDQ